MKVPRPAAQFNPRNASHRTTSDPAKYHPRFQHPVNGRVMFLFELVWRPSRDDARHRRNLFTSAASLLKFVSELATKHPRLQFVVYSRPAGRWELRSLAWVEEHAREWEKAPRAPMPDPFGGER